MQTAFIGQVLPTTPSKSAGAAWNAFTWTSSSHTQITHSNTAMSKLYADPVKAMNINNYFHISN